MRFSHIFGIAQAEPGDEAAGVTIDVLTGIVAGIALVLAILILSSSIKQAQSVGASAPILADTHS